MVLSTREVARLAGTTLRTVRHYHEIGLLDEPERLPNGYKAYRTEHLVRLLQLRRLTGLGLPLARIAAVADDPARLAESLDAVDGELAEKIALLVEARTEIAKLRREPVTTDLPHALSAAATEAGLSSADRSLFAVITHVVGDDTAPHWQALLRDYERGPADDAFDALAPDADEETRAHVARVMAPGIRALVERHPASPRTVEDAEAGRQTATEAVVGAMLDLYNPAQLDVLVRVWKAADLL
ncbi:MerR family transcriptional regulator [Streptomyces tremellae]|uniref:MerR family transcriptional regulator n=1 Tax=Streptomyces tremellae TaxID=1124239 RepID=A0ABP7DQP8_9ACTN